MQPRIKNVVLLALRSLILGKFTTEYCLGLKPNLNFIFGNRFNSTSVGTTHTAPGSVLVVVLRPASWHQREFKFTWKGVWNNYYTHLESVNYLDTENGEINESDGGASAFAYILNPTKADSSGNHLALNVELGIAGYELNCAALSYFIYDINEDGNLYEIARYALILIISNY